MKMDTGQTKQIIEQFRKMAETAETNTAALAAIAKGIQAGLELYRAHIARVEHAAKRSAEMDKAFAAMSKQFLGEGPQGPDPDGG